MTAVQRAEVRHLKWCIDSCLCEVGEALLEARDPEIQKALKKFYLEEGFEVEQVNERQVHIAPKTNSAIPHRMTLV